VCAPPHTPSAGKGADTLAYNGRMCPLLHIPPLDLGVGMPLLGFLGLLWCVCVCVCVCACVGKGAYTLAYNGGMCPRLNIPLLDRRVGMPAQFWLCVWVVVVGRLLVLSLWAGTPIYGVPPFIAMRLRLRLLWCVRTASHSFGGQGCLHPRLQRWNVPAPKHTST